jgi:hypothetical protein
MRQNLFEITYFNEDTGETEVLPFIDFNENLSHDFVENFNNLFCGNYKYMQAMIQFMINNELTCVEQVKLTKKE